MPAEQAAKIMLLGESIGFWIQTGAFFISAIGAVYVIRANGKQARNRATIDLVFQQKHDMELIKARAKVVELHEKNDTNLAKYLHDKKSEEYVAIRVTLNNYEFIATGIREGAFDEAIYKRMRYSVVMKDWEALEGVLVEIRNMTGIKTLFQEFEWMCRRWKKSPLTDEPPKWYRRLFSY